MVDFLGVNIHGTMTPVRNLLTLGFDKTYLTLPKTSTSDGLFEEKTRKTYNRWVRGEIASDFRKRAFSNRHPMVLGVALPGTVNKPMQDNPEVTVIGRANEGILDCMKHALTVVSAVRMREEVSQIHIDELLNNIHSAPQLHATMGRFALTLEQLDGEKYVYDADGSIATIEPTSFRIN
jgi:hypothetical protein